MKILVTGGAGYIGSTLIGRLLLAGHEVTVLDTLLHGLEPLADLLRGDRIKLIVGDIRDEYKAVEAHDAVVHLAAIVGDAACKEDFNAARSTNVVGTARLAGLCANKKFIFFSTCSNYGVTKGGLLATETTPVTPLSYYARTKVDAEKIIIQNGGTVLRMATICGLSPRMRHDLFVNDAARCAATGQVFDVYNPGARRPFTHIVDVARAVEAALDHDLRGIYNVVGENRTKAQIVDAAVANYGLRARYVKRGLDDRDYAVSGYRFQEATGWHPEKTVADAFGEVFHQAERDHAKQREAVA